MINLNGLDVVSFGSRMIYKIKGPLIHKAGNRSRNNQSLEGEDFTCDAVLKLRL
jgi:hypothetical protein